MSIKVTTHKTPFYWTGWARVYLDVLKWGRDPREIYPNLSLYCKSVREKNEN